MVFLGERGKEVPTSLAALLGSGVHRVGAGHLGKISTCVKLVFHLACKAVIRLREQDEGGTLRLKTGNHRTRIATDLLGDWLRLRDNNVTQAGTEHLLAHGGSVTLLGIARIVNCRQEGVAIGIEARNIVDSSLYVAIRQLDTQIPGGRFKQNNIDQVANDLCTEVPCSHVLRSKVILLVGNGREAQARIFRLHSLVHLDLGDDRAVDNSRHVRSFEMVCLKGLADHGLRVFGSDGARRCRATGNDRTSNAE